MAWTAPRNWVSGELVTAALMNTHIRDNETELRAGGLAIASQAAQDYIYASSASQLARLAAASGKLPKYNGASWAMSGGFDYVASTSTGAQNNWAPGINGNSVIFWNGAADAAITGMATGVAGQVVIIVNITTTKIATFAHQSGSSSAGNKFFNMATSGATPIAAQGSVAFAHDGTDWRLVHHAQGAWITPTFAAGDYTASAGNWTLTAPDVTTQSYKLEGRQLTIAFALTATTLSTTPGTVRINNGAFGGFTFTKESYGSLLFNDAGTAGLGYCAVLVAGTWVQLSKTAGTWSAATDTSSFWSTVTFEVT